MSQWRLGGGTGSAWDEDTQAWLQGTIASDIGDLSSLNYLAFDRMGSLGGFPDLSTVDDLRQLLLIYTQCMVDEPFPDWLVDGRFPNMDTIDLSFPNGNFGNGLNGSLPEFGDMSGLDQFNIYFNGLDGQIPHSFFTCNPNGIKKFRLENNNFTSLENNDLTNLSGDGRDLNLRGNELSGQWPYVDWNNYGGSRVRLDNNKYNFADMLFVPPNAPGGETCFELYQSLGLSTFSYSPQKQLGSVNDLSGNTIDFSTVFTHADNNYTWYRNGSVLSGETSNTLDVSAYNPGDDFYLEVTNPGVSGLTIRSITITI